MRLEKYLCRKETCTNEKIIAKQTYYKRNPERIRADVYVCVFVKMYTHMCVYVYTCMWVVYIITVYVRKF